MTTPLQENSKRRPRKVGIEIPFWVYRYFAWMHKLDSEMSKKHRTIEKYIEDSIISMIKEIDPDGSKEFYEAKK